MKSHLHPPFLAKIHVVQPESQPDATGFSVAEPGAIQANPSTFAEDFLAEHSSSGVVVAQAVPLTGSILSAAPTGSKSAQA
ncbi:MAG: hypothetical protein ACLQG3_11005 [Terracidiphilus sp.]